MCCRVIGVQPGILGDMLRGVGGVYVSLNAAWVESPDVGSVAYRRYRSTPWGQEPCSPTELRRPTGSRRSVGSLSSSWPTSSSYSTCACQLVLML